MESRYFSKKVIRWYKNNKRDLPWRDTTDPYYIWLSEIILQQTRVNQGLPYYLKFVETFPTVFDLAAAPEQKVLRLWQGLGYYTRARNLHKCAKEVVAKHTGKFPQTFDELKTLPGIGDYTAAAIASFSFGQRVAVVDGNVFRVLARNFGIDTPINSPDGKKIFSTLANQLVPAGEPDLHNQAMMEFGARFCTPRNPLCESCTFKETCFAQKNNLQHNLPVKLQLKKIRKRYFYYFVVQKGKSLLMKKREAKDIWHGLYDFYLIETSKPTDPEKLLRETDTLKKFRQGKLLEIRESYKHILSHQIIHATFIPLLFPSDFTPPEAGLKFYSFKKVSELPKPVLISKFLSDSNIL
jgi:A/G-specific adenine glycosylase